MYGISVDYYKRQEYAKLLSFLVLDCGKIETSHGNMQSILANRSRIEIACKEGYKSNVSVSFCEKGSWSVPALHCTSGEIVVLLNYIYAFIAQRNNVLQRFEG